MLEGRESAKERSLVTSIRAEGIEESIMERATNNNQNNQNRYPNMIYERSLRRQQGIQRSLAVLQQR